MASTATRVPEYSLALSTDEMIWLSAEAIADDVFSSDPVSTIRNRRCSLLDAPCTQHTYPHCQDEIIIKQPIFRTPPSTPAKQQRYWARTDASAPYLQPASPSSQHSHTEWIYRRPNLEKYPHFTTPPRTATPPPSDEDSTPTSTTFWTSILRPRTKNERTPSSSPLKSTSTRSPIPPSHVKNSKFTMATATPIMTATQPTPTTPNRPRSRSTATNASAASTQSSSSSSSSMSSCQAKSILTRSASSSTKYSSDSTIKSVKFVDIPMVHYQDPASPLQEEEEEDDEEEDDKCTVNTHTTYWDSEHDLRSGARSPTPTPQTLNSHSHSYPSLFNSTTSLTSSASSTTKLNRFGRFPGIKRFIGLASEHSPPTLTSKKPGLTENTRPFISGPYLLGSPPPQAPPSYRGLTRNRSLASLSDCYSDSRTAVENDAASVRSKRSTRSHSSGTTIMAPTRRKKPTGDNTVNYHHHHYPHNENDKVQIPMQRAFSLKSKASVDSLRSETSVTSSRLRGWFQRTVGY